MSVTVQAPQGLVSIIPEKCDATQIQLAYGNRAIPKLISELSSHELMTCQRALIALSELFHAPDNSSYGLQQGTT